MNASEKAMTYGTKEGFTEWMYHHQRLVESLFMQAIREAVYEWLGNNPELVRDAIHNATMDLQR